MPGSVTGRLLDMGYYKLPLGIASILLIICALLIAQCTQYRHFLLCQGIGFGVGLSIIVKCSIDHINCSLRVDSFSQPP